MNGNQFDSPFARACSIALTLALTGCIGADGGFNLSPLCESQLVDPDITSDPNHCGGCDVVCEPIGGVPACVDGTCVAAACLPGWFDLDGNPATGCECQGATLDTCTVCLPYDIPGNNIDEDCDGETTEGAGLAIPVDRVNCGAAGASCLLARGAAGVECAWHRCTKRDYDAGHCGYGYCEPANDGSGYDCAECMAVEPGTRGFEGAEQCFDGLDDDGNGVRDDGPYCEVLLANAVTSACSGAPPSAECPPNHVTIPVGEDGPLRAIEVALTYDFVLDRHEVTRAQYAAYLRENGRCRLYEHLGLEEMRRDCVVTGSAARYPITGKSWCEALSYCDWAGKRLPTLAEYYRAASADRARYGDPLDAQGPGREPTCDAGLVPVTARCGAEGLVSVEQPGGDAFIGSAERSEAWLIAKAIRHLTGNVAEWVLDSATDWCAEARAGHPLLWMLVCPAPGQPGNALQRVALVDPVFIGGWDRWLCGGSWASALDTDLFEIRQRSSEGNGLAYAGFRCARTIVGDGWSDPIAAAADPYNRSHMTCGTSSMDPWGQ